MKSLITSLMLLVSLSSTAFASSDCSLIPGLRRDARAQTNMAEAYEENVKNYQEIVGDAKTIRNISATLAISSGVLFLGGGAGVMASLAPGAGVRSGFITMTTLLVRAVPTMLGGLAGGLLLGDAGMFGMLLGHADAIYYLGNGIYQLIKGDDVYEIDMKALKQLDTEIKKTIVKVSSEIETELDNAPSSLSNGISLGGKNYRHFLKISQMAEIRARLQYDLAKLSKARLEVTEIACEKR